MTQMVSAERAAALRKAVNVSAPGTIETCRRTLKRSAYGGRPEVVCARSKRRFDPDLTSNGCRTTSDRVGIPPRNGGNALGGFLRLVAEYVSYFALRTTEEIIQCQCLLLQELGDSASLTTDRRASKSQAAPTRLTS